MQRVSPRKKQAAKKKNKSKVALKKTATRKQKITSAKKKSPKTNPERIPNGFSLRLKTPKQGQRPLCKGCGLIINYDDHCVRHKYFVRPTHKHPAVDQFHCKTDCIKMMKANHLNEFLNTPWRYPVVQRVVKELNR